MSDDGTSCTFTSRNYAVGDVWYPRLGQRGALHCVACICQEVNKTTQQNSTKLNISFHIDRLKMNSNDRAGKSTAQFTNAADRIALRPNQPPPTNVASIVPVSCSEIKFFYYMTCELVCHKLDDRRETPIERQLFRTSLSLKLGSDLSIEASTNKTQNKQRKT